MSNIGNMGNEKLICFRVDEAQKTRIEAAADIQNKSVTSFVKEIVMSAVEKVESHPPKPPKACDDVPSWFPAFCREAQKGGAFGFRRVGHRFGSSIPLHGPPGCSADEWQEQMKIMKNRLDLAYLCYFPDKKRLSKAERGRHEALIQLIWDWFAKNFPNAMKMIPPRRQTEFVQGFLDYSKEEIVTRHGCSPW